MRSRYFFRRKPNYHTILKRVGIVLIMLGILDLAYMIFWWRSPDQSYFYPNNTPSYSSSVTILGIVGVLLFRGNLRIVSIVTWFVAFTFSMRISTLIESPFSDPTELWAIAFRLDPVSFSLSFLVKITLIVLLLWIYRQLRAAPVVSQCIRAGHSAATPKLAFILGVGLVALINGSMYFIRGSAAGAKAVEIARTEYGDIYKYHFIGISWENEYVRARFVAYNEQEIKYVRVEWER